MSDTSHTSHTSHTSDTSTHTNTQYCFICITIACEVTYALNLGRLRFLDLEGYQNKECKAYKLTLDNGKEPYHWTSNLQLVSKVYMRKHPSQPRTHSINANDKKMVSAKVKALS